MTEHERLAREYYARICCDDATRWRVVRDPEPGVIYDFADPVDRKYGQCWRTDDGKAWKQAPLGERPVILAYRKRGEHTQLSLLAASDPAHMLDGVGRAVRRGRLSPFESAVTATVMERGQEWCFCGHLFRLHYQSDPGTCTTCQCRAPRRLVPAPAPEGTSAHAQWRTRWRQRIAALLPHGDRETPPNLGRADDVARSLARLWPIVREVAGLDGPIARTEVATRNLLPMISQVRIVAHAVAGSHDAWIVFAGTCSGVTLGPLLTLRRHRDMQRCYQPNDDPPWTTAHALIADLARTGDRSSLAVYLDLLAECGIEAPPLDAWRTALRLA